MFSALCEQGENGFLRVQPVFRLIENGLRISLENLFRDFFSAISRKTVHDQSARFRLGHHVVIDLIRPHLLAAISRLILPAPAAPSIR